LIACEPWPTGTFAAGYRAAVTDAPRPLTHAERTPRFLLVGLWNTAFGWGAYVAFAWAFARLGWSYRAALLPTQVVAVANAYVFQRAFVFADGARDAGTLPRFLGVYGVTFAVNLALLPLLVELAGLPPWLAQGVALALMAVLSYVGNLLFAFRVPASPSPP
jgi:putative flippase GtrA